MAHLSSVVRAKRFVSIIVIIIGILSATLLFLEAKDTAKAIISKTWQQTSGNLCKWNIRTEQVGDDTTLHVDEFKYTYAVNGVDYESNVIGYGFPNGMSVIYTQKTLDEVLKDSPSLKVFYNPKNPKYSVLIAGIRIYHASKVIGCSIVLSAAVVIYTRL